MSKEHVKALRIAKDRMESGDCVYICDALRRGEVGASNEIRAQIYLDIEGKFSLAEWLQSRGHNMVSGEGGYEVLLPTRLAWIDAMIEYWKHKP